MSDDAIDDFVDILPDDGKAGPAAVTVVTTRMGRQKAVRLSLTFRTEAVDEDARAILAAPRFNVAFSRRLFCLRIVPADGFGRFQMIRATRGAALILRLPLPEGLAFVGERIAARWDVVSNPRALVVDLPREYAAAPRAEGGGKGRLVPIGGALPPAPTPSPAALTASVFGDPPRGRSALDAKLRGE